MPKGVEWGKMRLKSW